MSDILVVVDDENMKECVGKVLGTTGYDISYTNDGKELFKRLHSSKIGATVIGHPLIKSSRQNIFRQIKKVSPDTQVIVISEDKDEKLMEEKFDNLIFDQIFSTQLNDSLAKQINWCMHKKQLEDRSSTKLNGNYAYHNTHNAYQDKKVEIFRNRTSPNYANDKTAALVGESEAIRHLRQSVEEIKNTSMNVMIRGESGTGKEVVASLLNHSTSGEWTKDNVKINCPSIPESLLESELFGHEAGAFTGAQKAKPGRLEIANNGTVFLDEIGDIPVSIQAKLLQFIESKQFTRVGGVKTMKINTRILSATNANLEEMIARKEFRHDLYYRLNEYGIYIPPLRERTEDIPLLVDHYCHVFGQELGNEGITVSSDTLSKMMSYNWPGNIRELRAAVKRYVFSGNEDSILKSIEVKKSHSTKNDSLHNELENYEQKAIQSALIQAKWNRRKAAQILGVSYSSLRRRIAKYNM